MKNFPFAEQLKAIFEGYSDDYEYTSKGIFRKIKPPLCADCGTPMNHNGFNNHTKRLLGNVKIGKYLCSNCSKNIEEEHCPIYELHDYIFMHKDFISSGI